jgi:hypothetical protein
MEASYTMELNSDEKAMVERYRLEHSWSLKNFLSLDSDEIFLANTGIDKELFSFVYKLYTPKWKP